MNFNEYQKEAHRTAGSYKTLVDMLLNGAMGASGESGEVLDHMKKVIFQGHQLNPAKLKEEIGDILWYVALIATALGVPLEQIAQQNVDKLRIRYPAGFNAEDSIKRVDMTE